MNVYVFDIETDGLLNACETVWIIYAINIVTGERHEFLPHKGDMRWVELFDAADSVIGHFITSFDILALEKVYGYKFPRSVRVVDTLIMSMILDYNRFGKGEGHSLERWGVHLGQAKQAHEDWSQYSEEMRTRCISDVEINVKVFAQLKDEYTALLEKNPAIQHYLRAEHYVAEWCGQAEMYGWTFDVPAACALFERMGEELEKCRSTIQPLLGLRTAPVDRVPGGKYDATGCYMGEAIPKSPKWTMKGCYDAHTANWFDINPWSGYEGEERMVAGEYSRVEFKPIDLDSVADVKVFLTRNGWEPTEWNYKKKLNPDTDRYDFIKTSPKITEDSLEALQGHGKLYSDFLTTKSRHAILRTWLANVDANGNLHGESFTVGTPSMRLRHSIIVNVPSTESAWGKEMRALFTCPEGWELIGCDSSGNQARGLAHYLGDESFTNTLLNGDIHKFNADILKDVLMRMGIDWDGYLISKGAKESTDAAHPMTLAEVLAKSRRAVAKRILYAFLFGASGNKLWTYVFGGSDAIQGNKLKGGFTNAVPGFKSLLDKLKRIYKRTSQFGDGYIPSIAGNKVYVDSLHKLLVYLLQSCEKATCSQALADTMLELEARNIPYRPCIFMHDEIDFMVPKEFGEEARLIGQSAFHTAPMKYGITIMAGEGKRGENWYEIH